MAPRKKDLKICLFQPPKFDANKYGKSVMSPESVIINLPILAAVLIDTGYKNISIYDLFDHTTEEIIALLKEEKPNIVGISVLTEGRQAAFKLARLVKSVLPGTIVVLGGPHATHLAEQIMASYPFVDIIVVGEGEYTFKDVINAIYYKKALNSVKGVVFRNAEGKIIKTENRQMIENLDALPLPAYALIKNMQFYKKYSPDGKYNFSVITSRGCPNRCLFCATSVFWGRRWRMRSAESIMKEIDMIAKAYGISSFSFADDAFTVNRARVVKICTELIKRGTKWDWGCTTRADFLDDDILKLMKEAGCCRISIGVESGSSEILKTINKNLDLNKVIEVCKSAHRMGITITGLFMAGNPGENAHTVAKSRALIKKCNPMNIGASITMVFPETGLYRLCQEKGLIDDSYWLTEFPAPFYDVDASYWKLRQWVSTLNKNNSPLWSPLFTLVRDYLERFFKIRLTKEGKNYRLILGSNPVTVTNWRRLKVSNIRTSSKMCSKNIL